MFMHFAWLACLSVSAIMSSSLLRHIFERLHRHACRHQTPPFIGPILNACSHHVDALIDINDEVAIKYGVVMVPSSPTIMTNSDVWLIAQSCVVGVVVLHAIVLRSIYRHIQAHPLVFPQTGFAFW
jgi:hypothetical protein